MQLDELRMYLENTIPSSHDYYGMQATPVPKSPPPIWMLGSGEGSARLAAEKGLPYMFAQFINGEGGQSFTKRYKEKFIPHNGSKPYAAVAIFAVCQETAARAEFVASSLDLSLAMAAQGMPSGGTPPPERALAYPYSKFERLLVTENRKRMIVGTPKQVADALERLAEEYGAEEVMIVSAAYDFQDKLETFRLIAEELNNRAN